MSTGAGPFTYYTSGSRSGSSGYVAVPAGTTAAQFSKQQQAADIGRSLNAISTIHRAVFGSTQKARAPLAPMPPYAPIRYLADFRELNQVRWFHHAARRAAKVRAREAAQVELRARATRAEARRAEQQAEIDAMWDRLAANDVDAVLDALRAAFDDNAAPTAAVGVDGNVVSLAVLVPDGDAVIPEREAGYTPKGNVSLKKMNKSARASWYRELVAGHVVISAVEALAVAPGLRGAAVVAFHREGRSVVPILAVRLGVEDVRADMRNARTAWDIVAAKATYNRTARTGELIGLDLSDEPDLAKLAAAIDTTG